MALTLQADNTNIISLADFVDHVQTNVDICDPHSICEVAPMIRALANNRDFLVEALGQQLDRDGLFGAAGTAFPMAFHLARRPNFVVRAVAWAPESKSRERARWESHALQFSVPHSHNFDLLTVGYAGPGYKTSVYTCDPSAYNGVAGERVELKFLERTDFPVGKIMFYEAKRDIHWQEYPTDFSVSLNLITMPPNQRHTGFHTFDVEQGRITEDYRPFAHGAVSVALCEMAAHLGGDKAVAALEKLAHQHVNWRVRTAAFASLASLGDEVEVWRQALSDPHPEILRRATQALASHT